MRTNCTATRTDDLVLTHNERLDASRASRTAEAASALLESLHFAFAGSAIAISKNSRARVAAT